jgi:hypothetical protein
VNDRAGSSGVDNSGDDKDADARSVSNDERGGKYSDKESEEVIEAMPLLKLEGVSGGYAAKHYPSNHTFLTLERRRHNDQS